MVPQYIQIGNDSYSCVPPPGQDIDPAVLAAIHEFDPGAIPIWRTQLWSFPWSTEVYRVIHVGIARYYPIPRYVRRHFHVDMPADADFPAPNFLDAMFEETDTLQYRMGGPGDYVPFGWNAYYWCRWQFDRITAEKWEAAVDRRIATTARLRAAWEAEIDYRRRQIEPWILKKLEGVSDADWAEALKLMWDRPKDITLRKKKPFVHLGRSPRPDDKTYGRVAPV